MHLFKKIIGISLVFVFLFAVGFGVQAQNHSEETLDIIEATVYSIMERTDDAGIRALLTEIMQKVEDMRISMSRDEAATKRLVQVTRGLQDINSFRTELELGFEEEDSGSSFDFSGSFTNDIAKEEMEGEVSISFHDTFSGSFSVDLEMVLKDGEFYLKVGNIPPHFLMFDPEFAEMAGKWIYFPREMIEEFQEETEVEMYEELGRELGVDPQEVEEVIMELFYGFLETMLVEHVGRERVGRKMVDKYLVTPDPVMTKRFITGDFLKFIETIGEEEVELSREDKREMREAINFLRENVEIYVWMDDTYLYQIEIKFYWEEEKISFYLRMAFDDFNRSFQIRAPEKEIDISDLVEEAQTEAFDTTIRSYLAGTRSSMEAYYYGEGAGSYANYAESIHWEMVKSEIPDCSSERLRALRVENPGEYQMVIEDEKQPQRYLAFAPFCASDGWYCIDFRGNAMEVSKMPSPDAQVSSSLDCEEYR